MRDTVSINKYWYNIQIPRFLLGTNRAVIPYYLYWCFYQLLFFSACQMYSYNSVSVFAFRSDQRFSNIFSSKHIIVCVLFHYTYRLLIYDTYINILLFFIHYTYRLQPDQFSNSINDLLKIFLDRNIRQNNYGRYSTAIEFEYV